MIAKVTHNNKIEVYDHSQFSARDILQSGQVFRYFKGNDEYTLVVGSEWARLLPLADKTIIECSSADFFWCYFDLNTDYNEIKKQLSRYSCLQNAIKSGGGIRILRADFYETVVSFIISANNNIARFTKTLNIIAEQYGEQLACGYHAFPKLEQLSQLTANDFRRLGCGYRADYLPTALQQLTQLNVGELTTLSTKEQDKELRMIKGVGAKVSACVQLFSGNIHNLSVCPQDTWIKKALALIPNDEHSVLLNHPYAGVAQQYIFHRLQHLHLPL